MFHIKLGCFNYGHPIPDFNRHEMPLSLLENHHPRKQLIPQAVRVSRVLGKIRNYGLCVLNRGLWIGPIFWIVASAGNEQGEYCAGKNASVIIITQQHPRKSL